MNIRTFLKDQWVYVGTQTFFLVIFTAMLDLLKMPASSILFLAIVYVVFCVAGLGTDYYKRARFLHSIQENLKKIDQKYLVLDTVEMPIYHEGRQIYDALYEINKSMNEHVKAYRQNVEDYKDYIEMWVHEVKLPLASLTLIVHNMETDDGTRRKLKEQLMRLDNYADQILYYVRSENASADYQFRKTALKSVVAATAQKNRSLLQERDISFSTHDLEVEVLTDSKWLEFMINQILGNSVKYMKQDRGGQIEIFGSEEKDQTILHIRDNGIGIKEADLPRIFDKSFTGDNGRTSAKSTGMGLYIVKKLCDQMGHKISVESEEGVYTEVKIAIGASLDSYKSVRFGKVERTTVDRWSCKI